MCFKGLYAFIGRLTPREEKLAENLRLEKKKNAKLGVKVENATFRVEMEINHRIQIQNKNHELTCQLKEQKAINADQAEELKRQKEINQALEKENKKLRKLSLDNKLKIFGTGIFGVLTGFALKR
jgi:hypothetical protein